MRVIFCDDDVAVLNQIQKYVGEFFRNIGDTSVEYAAYTSGDDLLSSEKYADIAFLDIEMPGQNGIHVGAQLKALCPKIKIFIITSYSDYLDEAMRFQVFRYLSKPIDKNRLFRNLKDAMYQYNTETKDILIETQEGLKKIPAERIVCVELIGRKTLIHTLDGLLQSTGSIEQWKDTLSLPCFYSTYRSYIVNMRFVHEIKRDIVVLKYGEQTIEAYLARRKYAEFCEKYVLYLGSIK